MLGIEVLAMACHTTQRFYIFCSILQFLFPSSPVPLTGCPRTERRDLT